jgi:hypothetical protein
MAAARVGAAQSSCEIRVISGVGEENLPSVQRPEYPRCKGMENERRAEKDVGKCLFESEY